MRRVGLEMDLINWAPDIAITTLVLFILVLQGSRFFSLKILDSINPVADRHEDLRKKVFGDEVKF